MIIHGTYLINSQEKRSRETLNLWNKTSIYRVVFSFHQTHLFYCYTFGWVITYQQTRCSQGCSMTPPSLTDLLINSSFVKISSKHYLTQTVRARELEFWENDHPPPCVTWCMSGIPCHASHVTCHLSHFTFFSFFLFFKWWSLLVEGLLSTGLTPSSFKSYYMTLFKMAFFDAVNAVEVTSIACSFSPKMINSVLPSRCVCPNY